MKRTGGAQPISLAGQLPVPRAGLSCPNRPDEPADRCQSLATKNTSQTLEISAKFDLTAGELCPIALFLYEEPI